MKGKKYAIGIDYGTESGRATLIDIATGAEMATHVTNYSDGVISEYIPSSNTRLPPEYALQNPNDYLQVLKQSVPNILQASRIDPDDVIGIGIDFTSCTILPVDKELEPLCSNPEFKKNPHSWVKLWKHHAAQEEADRIVQIAEENEEPWLKRYGGKISSEWMLPKVLQIVHEAPEIYDETDIFLEGADWVTAKMTGEVKRNSCSAGYKGIWSKQDGYVSSDFLRLLHPKLTNIYDTKLRGEVVSIGSKAGSLEPEMAEAMGLKPGVAVAVGIIDAHAGVPGVGVTTPGKMAMVMGTSTCHLIMDEKEVHVEGVSGVVEDGVVPGYFAYEAGQAAVGDIFAWYVDQCAPAYIHGEAKTAGISVHKLLEEKASKLKPGGSGLLALDWHNGNRTPLVNASLSGMVIGQTLSTKPEEIYRALIEATAFGTMSIIDTFRNKGIEVNELFACGGLPHRNQLLMQIYSDVTDMEIKVSSSTITPAIGSAMFGAVAAGVENGGHDSIFIAAKKMSGLQEKTFKPNADNVKAYKELYEEYLKLQRYFGRGENDVMKRLKQIKARANEVKAQEETKISSKTV